jgi:hypothetical protein
MSCFQYARFYLLLMDKRMPKSQKEVPKPGNN